MKITIDENICKKYGFSPEEVMFLLCVKVSDVSPDKMLEDALQNKKIYFNQELGKYLPIDYVDEKLQNILLDSELSLPEIDRFEVLAVKLMDIFPSGKKEGTTKYWKGNKKKVAKRLEKFCKIYGQYTDDDIIKATEHYVSSFNGNYTYMRLLEYFIIKDVKKMGEDGNYVEQESELASCLENAGQADYNNNWTADLK